MPAHVRSRLLGAQISKVEDRCFTSEDTLRFLDKLLAMLERETRAVAALSRSMNSLSKHERIRTQRFVRHRVRDQASTRRWGEGYDH